VSETRIITCIEIQQKRRDRFSVFLDGEFAFGVHRDTLVKSGIAKGDVLSEKHINDIQELEAIRSAKEKAMRLLAARPRSTKELTDRLKQAKHSSTTIESVLLYLERIGLLNDSEFGKMYARSKMISKPMGEYLLKRELFQKGLNEEDIQSALDVAYAENSEEQVAWELASNRKKRFRDLDEIKAKKRLLDFLSRRGFSWEIISKILDNWKEL
jgi:regulatory protein